MCVYALFLSSLPPPLSILISPICCFLFVLPSGRLSVYSPLRCDSRIIQMLRKVKVGPSAAVPPPPLPS